MPTRRPTAAWPAQPSEAHRHANPACFFTSFGTHIVRPPRTAATLAALALATTACGTTAGDDDEDTAASGPVSGLRVMVPNSPGSGYDQTARAATKAMEDADLAETVRNLTDHGARTLTDIRHGPGYDYVAFADPEGNEYIVYQHIANQGQAC